MVEEGLVPKMVSSGGNPLLLLMEEWRRLFARAIASRNPDLTMQGINLAVQCIIDRLLFLWICEGRGLEPAGSIAAIGEATSPDTALHACFLHAAERYGGIFPREGCSDPLGVIVIDGASVRSAVRLLGSPGLPDPRRVSPEELGDLLEHLLGSKIRIVDGHAVIGPRYDVERAGGVQAIPWPVLEHVVAATLAPLVSGDGPGGTKGIAIVDPACGTGRFLLAAYRYLSVHLPGISSAGCLYGLDLDPAAAEAARLVLALALLDPGRPAALPLPELDRIRSGNALIGPDFYDDVRTKTFDHERRERINALSWKSVFPDVLRSGGFDAILSAPPPIRSSPGRVEREYLERHYAVYHGGGALPPYFIERGLSLLRVGGRLGYAISGDWLRSKYGRSLRRLLLSYQIDEIVACLPATARDSDMPAPMPLSLLVAERSLPGRPFLAARFPCSGETDLSRSLAIHGHPMNQADLGEGGWTLEDKRATVLASRLAASDRNLSEHLVGPIRRGIPVPEDQIIGERLQARLLAADRRLAEVLRPFHSADAIGRFVLRRAGGRYVIRIPADDRTDEYLGLVAAATEKAETGPLPCSWQSADEAGDGSSAPRILMSAKAARLVAALDPDGSAVIDDSVIVVPSGAFYLLGLLNSRLFAFLIGELSPPGRPIAIRSLQRLPIVTLDMDLPEEAALYSKLVGIVEERIVVGHTDTEHPSAKAADLDRRIDAVVYDIYGLSTTERDIVERSTENSAPDIAG